MHETPALIALEDAAQLADEARQRVWEKVGLPKTEPGQAADPDGVLLSDLGLRPYGIGVDCHSRFFAVCALIKEPEGYRCYHREVEATFQALSDAGAWVASILRAAGFLKPDEKGVLSFTYTLESTGCYHLPCILAWGGSPCLVNPLLAQASRRKTDRLDARLLAYHSLTGLWPTSFIASSDLQTLRVLIGNRRREQRQTTAAVNRINNILLRYGHTIGRRGSVASSHIRPVVEDLCANRVLPGTDGIAPIPLPPDVATEVLSLYASYDAGKARAAALMKQATRFVNEHDWPVGSRRVNGKALLGVLSTIPGFGAVTCLTWLAEIGDPTRFPNAKACSAFCGFDPSLKVSAGHVTSQVRRRGNGNLNHALNQASQVLVRTAREPIGQWGRRLWMEGGKGRWFRAVGAVGRRISQGAYWVHTRVEAFDYSRYGLDAPIFPCIPLSAMGLSARVEKLLAGLGYQTSEEVVAAWRGNLRSTPGVGPRALKEIQEWHRKNATPVLQNQNTEIPTSSSMDAS